MPEISRKLIALPGVEGETCKRVKQVKNPICPLSFFSFFRGISFPSISAGNNFSFYCIFEQTQLGHCILLIIFFFFLVVIISGVFKTLPVFLNW